jgi:hypothetical protein
MKGRGPSSGEGRWPDDINGQMHGSIPPEPNQPAFQRLHSGAGRRSIGVFGEQSSRALWDLRNVSRYRPNAWPVP